MDQIAYAMRKATEAYSANMMNPRMLIIIDAAQVRDVMFIDHFDDSPCRIFSCLVHHSLFSWQTDCFLLFAFPLLLHG